MIWKTTLEVGWLREEPCVPWGHLSSDSFLGLLSFQTPCFTVPRVLPVLSGQFHQGSSAALPGCPQEFVHSTSGSRAKCKLTLLPRRDRELLLHWGIRGAKHLLLCARGPRVWVTHSQVFLCRWEPCRPAAKLPTGGCSPLPWLLLCSPWLSASKERGEERETSRAPQVLMSFGLSLVQLLPTPPLLCC